MRATTNTLDNNRVELLVEVDESELEAAIDATASQLSRQINIKGFRQGKAPKKLIEARLGGASALRAEAIRSSLSDFYAKAVSESLIDPIGEPDVEITGGQESGVLVFAANVEVRPVVDLIGYRDLRVTIPSPIVNDDEIEAQITRVRETDSELRDVDRPIMSGDVLLVDVNATDPAEEQEPIDVEDFSYTVGTEPLAQGLDVSIIGYRAGETLEAMGRRGAGIFLLFRVKIKQVRERILPDLTDEWVVENTEYGSVAEWRDGLMTLLKRRKLLEAQFARREAAMLALSDLIDESVAPEPLIAMELDHRFQELQQRLEQQGINFEYFMEATNQSPEALTEMLRNESRRAVRVDLALRALVRAEGLEPTEAEFDDELALTATAMKVPVEVLRRNLYDNGRTVAFNSEVAKAKASKWLLNNATYIDETGAEIDRALLDTDHSGEEKEYGESDE